MLHSDSDKDRVWIPDGHQQLLYSDSNKPLSSMSESQNIMLLGRSQTERLMASSFHLDARLVQVRRIHGSRAGGIVVSGKEGRTFLRREVTGIFASWSW